MSTHARHVTIQVRIELLQRAFVGVGIVLKRATTIVLSVNMGAISIAVDERIFRAANRLEWSVSYDLTLLKWSVLYGRPLWANLIRVDEFWGTGWVFLRHTRLKANVESGGGSIFKCNSFLLAGFFWSIFALFDLLKKSTMVDSRFLRCADDFCRHHLLFNFLCASYIHHILISTIHLVGQHLLTQILLVHARVNLHHVVWRRWWRRFEILDLRSGDAPRIPTAGLHDFLTGRLWIHTSSCFTVVYCVAHF